MEINKDWSENAFVVKANLMHEKVHDGSHDFSNRNKVVRSSVAIYNDSDEYNLYGIADCIEFVKDNNGVKIEGLDGLYSVKIIEYKPKPPAIGDYHETDAIQVFAQKLCADFVWKCNAECYIYYSEIKKRIKLPFDSQFEIYNNKIKSYLCEMRKILSENKIPDREKNQKCSGCSLKDVCFPKNTYYSVKNEINHILKEAKI